ncbi:MAG: hypothetical protein ABJQ90_16365, partial [Parasphingorhabdus sp.]
ITARSYNIAIISTVTTARTEIMCTNRVLEDYRGKREEVASSGVRMRCCVYFSESAGDALIVWVERRYKH